MTRYALCVGINAYPDPSARLSGCVNDALDWVTELESRGYHDTTLLLDRAATKAGILAGLAGMVGHARYGDRIAFTYSGHGSWVPDVSGDEADRRDEVLCAYDYTDGGFVSDDDLHAVFSRKRFGVRAYIISDSCHSGTVSRFAAAAGRPRFLSPTSFLTDLDEATAVRWERVTPRAAPRPGAVLLSGCADTEYSYDAVFNGRPNGAMTRVAIDTLRGNPVSMKSWHMAIRRRLPSAEYPQSPQLGATSWQQRHQPLG